MPYTSLYSVIEYGSLFCSAEDSSHVAVYTIGISTGYFAPGISCNSAQKVNDG